MKKLLKHEWKCYGSAILLVVLVMIGYHLGTGYYFFYPDCNITTFLSYELPYDLRSACYVDIDNIIITVVAYCIFKLYRYQAERNSYGREFLATLPLKKRTVEIFYLCADCVFVLLPNIVYWIGSFIYTKWLFAQFHIEIPWLFTAMLPVIIVTAAYLLMLLAASHFVESLIVNGIWKIFGAAAMLIMLSGILIMVGETVTEQNVEDISGYIWALLMIDERASIYGYDYEAPAPAGYEEKWDDVWKVYEDIKDSQDADIRLEDLYNGEYGMDVKIYYDGGPVDEAFYKMAEGQLPYPAMRDDSSTGRRVCDVALDWLHFDYQMRSFEHYGRIPEPEVVWGNFLLAVMLLAFAILLADKKEAASQIFYFPFVKYVYAVLIGITICWMGMMAAESLWHAVLIIISSVFAAVLCVHWMTPEHKNLFGRKEKKKA
ncbi:MAG: hypothetical protein K2L07_07875 [Lachnospiraceae bacterium]|nr:hypothetical protein [Lachnospiraceae bacterium]